MLSLLLVSQAKAQVNTFGFMTVPNVLRAVEVAELISTLGPIDGAGLRGALRIPAVAALAHSTKILDLAAPHVGPNARPVRAIYFD